jgi:DNA polymerase III subunit epsilon
MPYLVLDLEMSGGEVGLNDIIQIGAVLCNDSWEKISSFETLVYPENEDFFDTQAEKVHGISIDDLQDAPSAYDALEAMEAWCRKSLRIGPKDSLKDVILCGQSVINDINFLKEAYGYLNLPWPFSFKLIDLLSITTLMYEIFRNNNIIVPKSYSLKAVADHFKIYRAEREHNALEDAEITMKCFQHYFEFSKKLRIQA